MSRALPLTGVPGKMTRRLAAVTLVALGVSVFLGALALRQLERVTGEPGRAQTYLWVGIVLAVLCVLASGTLRRRWGLTLGWVLLGLTLLSSLLLPSMAVVALVFAALWVAALVYGGRMDEMERRWSAQAQPGEDGDTR